MGLTDIVSKSLTSAIGALIGLGLIYFVVSTYLSFRKLQHIKGPWLASISLLWMFYYSCRGTLYLAVEDALRKYGKTQCPIPQDSRVTDALVTGSPVRIGPDYIATDDPVIQRHMAAPRSPFLKGRWFRGMKFDPRLDNLLSMSDEKAHAELRTKLMPGVWPNGIV